MNFLIFALMTTENKVSEEYWLSKIHFPFSLTSLPWGIGQRTVGNSKQAYYQSLPIEVCQQLRFITNNNLEGIQILFLSILKILLNKYLDESNIYINMYNSKGRITSTTVVNRDITLRELINLIRDEYLEAQQFEHINLVRLVEKYQVRCGHFIEEYVHKYSIGFGNDILNKNELDGHDFICQVTLTNDVYHLSVKYSANSDIAADFMHLFWENFLYLLQNIKGFFNTKISELDIRSEFEHRVQRPEFHATSEITFSNSCIHSIFESVAGAHPNHVALRYGEQTFTYYTLNEIANKLAKKLVKKGVCEGSMVGILFERNPQMIMALLGVLKAGGTYMPIDPNYPKERKEYMLTDSCAKMVITDSNQHNFESIEVVIWNELDESDENGENLDLTIQSISPAYVIYTSGTTGWPKGVLVSHANVTSLLMTQRYFQLGSHHVWALFHSFCFDFSVWEMFGALLHGGELVILQIEEVQDPELLIDKLQKYKVTILCQTPTAFYNLIDAELRRLKSSLTLQYIIFGGEALNLQKLDNWKSRYRNTNLINMYGITETTIHSTIKEIRELDISRAINTIGVPLPNAKLFILDTKLKQVPVGVTGEIFIGGMGIVLGYLNKIDLTAEKFIQLPGNLPTRLYKSGDLARILPNGEVEYIGRIDNQVKLNGFRIELEEIEAQLLNIKKVKKAVVVIREVNNVKALCAYVEAGEELESAQLREILSSKLPHYMVPSYIVQIEKIPLTPNGKKDKNLLPDVSLIKFNKKAPPLSSKEKIIAGIWQHIFGLENVDRFDEFYALGGDSIKAILFKSRLINYGFTISISDILRLNSLIAIAQKIQITHHSIDQKKVTGDVGLNPIQSRFISLNQEAYDHYNQSLLLHFTERLTTDDLERIFNKLLEHHDALRLKGLDTTDGFTAIIEPEVSVSVLYFDTAQETESDAFIAQEIIKVQRGIRLQEAPLVKLALFDTDNGTKVLIAVHHFVIDGVSWRILMDDFTTLYEQLRLKKVLSLPVKTHSIKRWNEELVKVAGKVETELEFWKQMCRHESHLFKACQQSEYQSKYYAEKVALLTERYGEVLVGRANQAYNTTSEELLIAALYLAFQEQYNIKGLMLNMEQHGRSLELESLDVSRTIGWFTSIFPFYLALPSSISHRETIIAVKEERRKIINGGIGYGLLRYQKVSNEEQYQLNYTPSVEFNYLGQFGSKLESVPFKVISYAVGELRDKKHKLQAPLVVNTYLDETQCLHLELLFNTRIIDEKKAEAILAAFAYNLTLVLDHCIKKDGQEKTRSDYTFKQLSQNKLDDLTSGHIVDDIYPLTSVQEGILFHHLIEQDTSVYFEQVAYLYNEEINIPMLYESLDLLSQRHDLLRSAYYYESLDRPLQIIYQNHTIKRTFEDISNLDQEAQAAYIGQCKESDQKRGFIVSEGPLIRLLVLRLAKGKSHFLWSFHHLIMDGWSLDIVNMELFSLYESLVRNKESDLLVAPSYKNFISWLENTDPQKTLDFWKQFLLGYDTYSLIPAKTTLPGQRPIYKIITAQLPDDQVCKLRKLASSHQITVNSLVQLAWGWVLSRYTNNNDVVFGLIVSGRPGELENIERMIGMFISTVPQRISFGDLRNVIELAKEIQERAIVSGDYQHYSLSKLKQEISNNADFFDHIFNYINYPLADRIQISENNTPFKSSRITNVEVFEQTHYSFAIDVIDYDDIRVKFNYNERVYDAYQIEQLLTSFLSVIGQIAEGKQFIDQLDILSGAQRRKLLHEFNHKTIKFEDKLAHQLFEEQVIRSPHRIALENEKEEITYETLNYRANMVARGLQNRYIGTQCIVSFVADHTIDSIITILGILKAGHVYLPIDSEYPVERIRYILMDSGAAVFILPNEGTLQSMKARGVNIYEYLSNEESLLSLQLTKLEDLELDTSEAFRPLRAFNMPNAYILYTSGSTGNPKGVLVQHNSIVSFIRAQYESLKVCESDIILQMSSLCFDTSVEDIFSALGCGARLVLVQKETYLDGDKLVNYITDHQITSIHAVPSFLNFIRPQLFTHLKRIITGGDVCPMSLLAGWMDKVDFFNSYGPTETTVTATQIKLTKSSDYCHSVPIGAPLGNTQIYILDEKLRLMPIGFMGEIYIAGEGLAAGYINQIELTHEKFIQNPYSYNEVFYKTGDIGRWLPDGTIEFKGRIDRQVKIRGYRVELEEIEYSINQYAYFENVVVLPQLKANRENMLVAYLCTSEQIDIIALKQHVAKNLADYMVPTRYVQVDNMPLRPNGKINFVELSQIKDSDAIHGSESIDVSNNTQTVLIDIWKETLDVERINVHDNFFDLGATSIDLMIVSGKLKGYYHIENILVKMFHYTTISTLAAYIDSVHENETSEKLSEEITQTSEIRSIRRRKRELRK